jgi:enamine deaminase RidA (YjgF/YER057c/UK114 family)
MGPSVRFVSGIAWNVTDNQLSWGQISETVHYWINNKLGGHAMKGETIVPNDRRAIYDVNKYSAAIRSGDLLFCSGHVGCHMDGTPEPDLAKQIDLAFQNLIGTLGEAGCTLDDVIDVTTFHTDPEAQFDTIMEVRDRYVKGPDYPNWTAVGVTWLNGFDFEMKVIARIK